jgi:redox-sensing transcriptional repressor
MAKRSARRTTVAEPPSAGAANAPIAASQFKVAVPKAVVTRLSLYLRELQHVVRDGHQTINSLELGQRLGCTDAQVRKDLATFGHFGRRGVGYRCGELIDAIRRILGTHEPWPVALVGVGNLGRALLGYRGFSQRGFHFVAALDADAKKVGLEIHGLRVHAMEGLPGIVRDHKIRLGVIAVPAAAAQDVADRITAAGIEGILNFAPVAITLPPTVSEVGVDVAIELERLAFSVLRRAVV